MSSFLKTINIYWGRPLHIVFALITYIFFINIIMIVAMAAVSCKSFDVEKAKENIEIVNEDGQTKLILSNLQFEANSAEITEEAANTLDSLKTVLAGYQGQGIVITGHAANAGDESAILVLSQQRADADSDSLVKNKTFKSDVISTMRKGASEPIGVDDTAAENRRVELNIIGYDL